MKRDQTGKPAKCLLPFGGCAVCLLLFSALCSGVVTAEVRETPQVQKQLDAAAPPNQITPQIPANQTAAQLPQVPPSEDSAVSEEEDVKVAKALEDLLQSMKMGDFEYQVDERPDPFMPFISDKIVQTAESDSEGGERLTGMRQLEPGQLSLTAILFTETNPMAMVEDSSKKGYVIRRGTRIGKFGIVTDILPNAVIIKQLSYSMSQEKKYTTVEMILRKEGEK